MSCGINGIGAGGSPCGMGGCGNTPGASGVAQMLQKLLQALQAKKDQAGACQGGGGNCGGSKGVEDDPIEQTLKKLLQAMAQPQNIQGTQGAPSSTTGHRAMATAAA